MALLRRVLYLQALVWVLAGMALAAAPRFVLVTLLGQPRYPEYAWVRLVGVEAFGLALLMVLVAHRIEELWWWSWAFVAATAGVAVVAALNAVFSLPAGASAWPWWLFAGLSATFAVAMVVGLGRTGIEKPPV